MAHITQYAHTMLRVKNLEKSIHFYRDILGLQINSQTEFPQGKFTLVFLSLPEDNEALFLELTYNWGQEKEYELGNGFGHLSFYVEDIHGFVQYLHTHHVPIPTEPKLMGATTMIAFAKDPDEYSIELIEKA